MEVTLEDSRTAKRGYYGNRVSILILMEVTLEERTDIYPKGTLLGFNPYSNGSYSGRSLSLPLPLARTSVSILILMEVTLEVFHGYPARDSRI